MIKVEGHKGFLGPSLRLRHVTPSGLQLGYIECYTIDDLRILKGAVNDLLETVEEGLDIWDPSLYTESVQLVRSGERE
jgi:hypothetical protein